jgi:transcriptional regulator with XRE-family HTH domain
VTIAEITKRARVHAELTQQGLADRAGVHVVTVSKLETGALADPSLSLLGKLAAGSGIKVSSLLRGWSAE